MLHKIEPENKEPLTNRQKTVNKKARFLLTFVGETGFAVDFALRLLNIRRNERPAEKKMRFFSESSPQCPTLRGRLEGLARAVYAQGGG